jgi:hypothetical protein
VKSVWLFRIAAIVLVLFGAGHTFGFLSFRPPNPEGLAVWEAMNRVRLPMGGNTFTYGGFYTAFGIDISLYLFFSAFLAWHLSGQARREPRTIGALGWAFVALQVGGLMLSWVYFGPVQVAFGAVLAICLVWAMTALPKSPA